MQLFDNVEQGADDFHLQGLLAEPGDDYRVSAHPVGELLSIQLDLETDALDGDFPAIRIDDAP